MRKTMLFFITLLFAFPAMTLAQTGTVFDDLSMPSEILGGERKYALYLPPCYETSHRSYPVLYLLHGAGDDQSGWIQFGEVMHITDNAIRDGKATPMIIVMPDANTGHRGYFNHINGEWRYEDFFFQELMPYVENKYRIRKEKRFRAISGLSMGGGGTFMYALRRPDLFSSAAPLSAYVGPLNFEEARDRFRFSGDTEAVSEAALREYWERHNAISLINKLPEENKRAVRWYIDCGDDDFLYEGNSLVHIAMKKNDIPHEFRIRDGGHTWTYWRESLPKVLEFVSQAFHQY
jgi:enterochelin esterase-like enzyme